LWKTPQRPAHRKTTLGKTAGGGMRAGAQAEALTPLQMYGTAAFADRKTVKMPGLIGFACA
jgi:hypothetical protein